MNGYLLDTNIAIAILAGEEVVIQFIQQASAQQMHLYFSVITECEIFSGIKSEFELHKIKLFTPKRCIEVNSKIARKAGTLRREQRISGRKLKTPDALIIATAIHHQLALVSRDSDMNFLQDKQYIPLIKL